MPLHNELQSRPRRIEESKLSEIPTEYITILSLSPRDLDLPLQVRSTVLDFMTQRDYLHRIGIEETLKYSCSFKRQTVQNTLLDCPKFNKLKEEIWSRMREKDLTRLLSIPALVTKVSKFLLATRNLYQFRYLKPRQTTSQTSPTEWQRWKTVGDKLKLYPIGRKANKSAASSMSVHLKD